LLTLRKFPKVNYDKEKSVMSVSVTNPTCPLCHVRCPLDREGKCTHCGKRNNGPIEKIRMALLSPEELSPRTVVPEIIGHAHDAGCWATVQRR
jgi:hypothetical protein